MQRRRSQGWVAPTPTLSHRLYPLLSLRQTPRPPMTVPPKGGFTRSEAKGGFVLQSTYSTLAKAVLACTSLLGLNSTFKQASTSWNLRQFLTQFEEWPGL